MQFRDTFFVWEGTALMLKSLKLIDSNPLVKLEFGKLKVKY